MTSLHSGSEVKDKLLLLPDCVFDYRIGCIFQISLLANFHTFLPVLLPLLPLLLLLLLPLRFPSAVINLMNVSTMVERLVSCYGTDKVWQTIFTVLRRKIRNEELKSNLGCRGNLLEYKETSKRCHLALQACRIAQIS